MFAEIVMEKNSHVVGITQGMVFYQENKTNHGWGGKKIFVARTVTKIDNRSCRKMPPNISSWFLGRFWAKSSFDLSQQLPRKVALGRLQRVYSSMTAALMCV